MKVAPSSLARIEACPGSWAVERQCAYQPPSEAAAEGTLLHSAMRPGVSRLTLTLEQSRLVDIAKQHGRELYMRHLPGKSKWLSEVAAAARLDERHVVSGRLDWIGYDQSTTLVIDWKFGRSAVDVAADNLQLRAYAVIAADFEGPRDVERVIVATVQPTVESDIQVTESLYTPEDIATSRRQLITIAERASKPDALRIPGDHCKYCKALGTALCPESMEQAVAVAKYALQDILPSGQDLAEWLERAEVAEQVVLLLRDHARSEIAAGRTVPGWRVTPPVPIRTLPSAVAVWRKLDGTIKPEDFMAVCKLGIGDLQSMLAEKLRWKSSQAKFNFNDLLGDAITMSEKRGSLQREKS